MAEYGTRAPQLRAEKLATPVQRPKASVTGRAALFVSTRTSTTRSLDRGAMTPEAPLVMASRATPSTPRNLSTAVTLKRWSAVPLARLSVTTPPSGQSLPDSFEASMSGASGCQPVTPPRVW